VASTTFTAGEKADLTKHLGISGGSSDAQISQAILDNAKGVKRVQDAPSPNCPTCGRPLPNTRSPMASSA
jgi:hypothetical protein